MTSPNTSWSWAVPASALSQSAKKGCWRTSTNMKCASYFGFWAWVQVKVWRLLAPIPLDYLAFDPNRMMRKLGRRILKHLGAGFNSAEYVTSLEDVDFTGTDQLLFTLSYVVHQDDVTAADIDEWASLIKRAVIEVDQDVELIFTTAKRRKGAHHALRRMLGHAKILGNPHTIDVQVRQRFPEPASSDGQICWDEKNRLWKVRAEPWILSA